MAIVVVCGTICGKMCGKIEKLFNQNKIWYGTRYGPSDDSGDKKGQKYKNRGPKGPPHPLQELEQGGHRPPKF